MDSMNNMISVAGVLDGNPALDHTCMDTSLFTASLKVERLSRAVDMIPLMIPDNLIFLLPRDPEKPIMVSGQIRTYNKIVDGAGRLLVYLFVQNISEAEESDRCHNHVTVIGSICKPPVFRSTPFGREISDVMLAVNRAYGKSNYVPCIAWGNNARYVASMGIGDRIRVTGRLQSRDYEKLMENGEYQRRTAYELSAFTIHPEPKDPAEVSA